MTEQEQIQVYKEYILFLLERLNHSDRMHEQAMEMVRNLMEKLK
jgi:hypothetical protein